MSDIEQYLREVICLQLKKPKNWNWEISTSKSSPHIALPTIQLYNSKGKLLVETNDNGTTQRQSWNSLDRNSFIQRSKSDNIEKKIANTRSATAANLSRKDPKYIQRCRSDTVAVRSSRSRNEILPPSQVKQMTQIQVNRIREPVLNGIKTERCQSILEKYNNDRETRKRSNRLKKSQSDILDLKASKLDNERIFYPDKSINVKKCSVNNNEEPYNNLKKSRSDVLDIKIKSKLLNFPSDTSSPGKPYHRRCRSDDLFQKTKRKFDIEESRKRAEIDGYANIIRSDSFQNRNKQSKSDDRQNKKNRMLGYLANAETVVCDNKPTNFQIKDVEKPRKYVLRQSRAGILVLTDESFSSSHRKRCHGDFGNCQNDKNDIHIEGDLTSSLEDLAGVNNAFRQRPQRSKSSKEISRIIRPNEILNSSANKLKQRRPNFESENRSTSFTGVINLKQDNNNNNLFYSKSDVFPFERIVEGKNDILYEKKYRTLVDNNCNYIVNEPLTTPESDNARITIEDLRKMARDVENGPLGRNQKTSNRDCDLLQLVRRLSSTKVDDKTTNQKCQKRSLRSSKSADPRAETPSAEKASRKENGTRHVSDGMGANVSRHSTKGLSGRRSQSSGSICNGKGRHQGDGSGKGSGGSLPSYLDDRGSTSTNHYEEDDDDQRQLDEDERIPPLGDGAPLHWKFSDGHTSQCNDQGYASERSPEEEYPPPLPEHDMEQCHHHLEAHSCYPFITPESTFTVKLNKGSRGLGLSVTGGVESGGSWPGLVRIKRLFPHQPASACGLLNVGDLLLEANGVPLTGLTNYEALEVLRTATNLVELKVCRPPPDVLNCVSPISEVPPPPPARREPPTSLNLSSTYYGNTPEDEYYHGEFEITLTKIQGSLGFTLRKEDDSALGHYVRALVRDPALADRRIRAGDKIIAVNDVEIFSMTHEQAVQYLRQCGDKVKLRLYRDSPQTPVATLSPTEITPHTSFSRKANLRQEAVDMLNDIAVRKLIPSNQQQARRSSSPTSSPRRLRRHNHPSDASQESSIKYLIPEEQFHEGMLKCNFDEESLFTIDSDDMDRPSRYEPNSLDLYNPNQTPLAARKPRFNFSLAHNAYELNNLDPEVLDAPNLTYTLGEEGSVPEIDSADSFPTEPASMPHIPLNNATFSYKNPAYQSAHPPCVDTTKNGQYGQKEETDTIKRKKGILKKDSNSSKLADKTVESKTDKIVPIKEEFEILAIELNRGWNSRLGFSLQGAAGVTYVSAVYADSVAARDGRIKPGDRIIKVNDENVEHMATSEIIDLLRIVRGPVCIFVKRIKSTEDCGKSNAEN